MVGISTGVLAATGNPVEVVTPDGPTKAAALEEIRTLSSSGAGPLVNIAVAVVPVATGQQELQTRIGEATRPLEPFCVQLRPSKDTADTVLKSGRGLPVKSALCLLSA